MRSSKFGLCSDNMLNRNFPSLLVLLSLALFTQPTVSQTHAKLGEGEQVEQGIFRYKAGPLLDFKTSSAWIYLPNKRDGKIPCVLIAPAGTGLFHGIGLSNGDVAEHLPYARAGFAVIAYELSGPIPQDSGNEAMIEGTINFRQVEAGVRNLKEVIKFIEKNVVEIDREQLFVAGHSSAATHALLASWEVDQIKGCLAYAPAVDVAGFVGKDLIDAFNSIGGRYFSGYRNFIKDISPSKNASKIKCPLFVFHSEEDGVVAIEETLRFVKSVQRGNDSVTLLIAEKGDHYNSMMDEGIPAGIEWLKNQIAVED